MVTVVPSQFIHYLIVHFRLSGPHSLKSQTASAQSVAFFSSCKTDCVSDLLRLRAQKRTPVPKAVEAAVEVSFSRARHVICVDIICVDLHFSLPKIFRAFFRKRPVCANFCLTDATLTAAADLEVVDQQI